MVGENDTKVTPLSIRKLGWPSGLSYGLSMLGPKFDSSQGKNFDF